MKSHLNRQRGSTLMVSLIMLVVMSLIAITTFRLGKGNTQIVGNMQHRAEAAAAAQNVLEDVLSHTQFADTPGNAIVNPVGGASNVTYTSVNGGSNPDIKVEVTSTCMSARVIPNNDPTLNWSDQNDAGCLKSADQNFGVAGNDNNNSLCANTLWDVQATATETLSNSQTSLNQGVAIRVPATTVCP